MTVKEEIAIAMPVQAAEPVYPETQPCLQVEAPATLPEGYTFDAQYNGQTLSVQVPAGGVTKRQKFTVPHPANADGSPTPAPCSAIPVGRWKDSLCDCCRFGCCHPVCCNAYFCQLLLLGQVMTRLKLTWFAEEGTAAQTAKTFCIMSIITIVSLFLSTIHSAGNGFRYAFFIFVVCLIAKTRRRIRQRYNIPAGCCGECDDCCTSFWCTCCAISQMARHTADYGTYAGRCCSETGLPPGALAPYAPPPLAASIV